jgi:putative transposase
VFEFIDREKTAYSIQLMCRTFKVSASGYHAWRKRAVCPRKQEDARLRELIVAIHARSRGTYGVPRIKAELRYDHGIRCSGKRVFRLMRMLGIQGKRKRRRFKTTWRSLEAKPAPDLVERNFVASRPDEVWVADIKYIRTREGFLYLAGVTDVFTRAVAGWAMSDRLQTKLVEDALEMAILRRRPTGPVIHHSDQGTQYTSLAFGRRLREAGILPSMGSRGDAFDNALAESFWSTLDRELLDDTVFINRAAARLAVFNYIESWFNPWRRHSSIEMLSPVQYERQWRQRNGQEVMA